MDSLSRPSITYPLQRLVTHYDQVEHKLFSEAKEAEAQRKKQSQIVQKMHDELEQLKRDNAKRLKVRWNIISSKH